LVKKYFGTKNNVRVATRAQKTKQLNHFGKRFRYKNVDIYGTR